jgi:DNA gyrase subunit B
VQEYKKGVPVAKVKKIANSDKTGTKTIFAADPEIFQTMEYSVKRILEHLRQQAYLTKGVRINFIDRREDPISAYGFYFDGGVKSFASHLSRGKKVLQDDIFYVNKAYEKIDVEVGIVYTDDIEAKELSFANNIFNPDGGMHVTGFRSAITRTLNTYARAEGYLKEKDENLTSEDMREGLIAVISVKLSEPQFEGQTKARLGSPEARPAVESVVSEGLKDYLEKHPQDGRKIIEKVLLAAKARKAAKAAKDTVLRKGALDGLTLPGKLADCSSRKAEESELFIVEGDSAGGSAKSGRDRRTQAILPLRGKVLNVEKAMHHKVFENEEIRNIFTALGVTIGTAEDSKALNLEKLRYHKVVIMCDADIDGSHISTLILTFFFRFMKELIEEGHVYIATPPLYLVKKGITVDPATKDIITPSIKSGIRKEAL